MIDPRTGPTTTVYNAAGQVEAVTDTDGCLTEYAYIASDAANAGRVRSIARETGETEVLTYFDYTLRGELFRTWGDVPQPVEYAYDEFGQRTGLLTYRTAPQSNGEPTDVQWPAGTRFPSRARSHRIPSRPVPPRITARLPPT